MNTLTEINIQSKLISRRFLTENTYIIRMERKGIEFRAGQFIFTVFLVLDENKNYICRKYC